jgi:hypothetical protein
VKPSAHLRLAAEPRQVPERPEKSLLHNVLGFLAAVGKALCLPQQLSSALFRCLQKYPELVFPTGRTRFSARTSYGVRQVLDFAPFVQGDLLLVFSCDPGIVIHD